MILNISHVSAGYGHIGVLHDVSFFVQAGELVALIGSNGAGKTTLLKAVSGALPIRSGSISFLDRRIDTNSRESIVKSGLVHVPEGRKLFNEMSVLENLELGAYTNEARKHKKENLERCYELFPILAERHSQLVGTMSGGQQQMVAIARGLMSHPKLLLLDEPSIGLSPLLTQQVFQTILQIKDMGVTVLLVEQNARQAVALADRSYVIENGRLVLEGTSEELLENDQLKAAYLGA